MMRSLQFYCNIAFHLLVFLPLNFIINSYRKLQKKLFKDGFHGYNNKIIVHKVIAKSKLRGEYSRLDDFVYIMKGYICEKKAEEILLKDENISLFSVNQSDIVFIRTTKGININDPNISSFLFNAHFQFAEELIFVPLEKFENITNRLLERRDEANSSKMILIASHPRCGGTLFAQCFQDYPNTIVLNEPTIFLEIFLNGKLYLMKHILAYIGKDLMDSKFNIISIKFPILLPGLLKDAMDISHEMPFPLYFFFVHRKPIPAFTSWMKLITVFSHDTFQYVSNLPLIGQLFSDAILKYHQNVYLLAQLSQLKAIVNDEKLWNEKYAWMENQTFISDDFNLVSSAVNGKNEKFSKTSFMSHFLTHWIIPMLILRELKTCKKYASKFLPVSYENLIASPEFWCNTVLPFCKIKRLNSLQFPTAFEEDSQRKSIFNRKELEKSKVVLTSDDKRKMSYLLQKFEMATDIDSYSFNF